MARTGSKKRNRPSRKGRQSSALIAVLVVIIISLLAVLVAVCGSPSKAGSPPPRAELPAATAVPPRDGTPAAGPPVRPEPQPNAPPPPVTAEPLPGPTEASPAAGASGSAEPASATGNPRPASSPTVAEPETPPRQSIRQPAGPGERPVTVMTPQRQAIAGNPPERPVRHPKKLVIIIDDVGNNLPQLNRFLALNLPLTFAVLPGVSHTKASLAKILAAGHEALLHQPMEAEGRLNPGPGAIMHGMNPDEVRTILAENLAQMPGVTGVNNHEGSLVTADPAIMAAVLDYLKEKKLVYIDSLTTAHSAVKAVAEAEKISIMERDVFLDNIQDRDTIIRYIKDGMRIAEKKGHAVMIGHVWSADLAKALGDMYPQLVEQGFSLSTIREIMMDETLDASTWD
jgi:uncharacterized protein